jgi:hypothetical protein
MAESVVMRSSYGSVGRLPSAAVKKEYLSFSSGQSCWVRSMLSLMKTKAMSHICQYSMNEQLFFLPKLHFKFYTQHHHDYWYLFDNMGDLALQENLLA